MDPAKRPCDLACRCWDAEADLVRSLLRRARVQQRNDTSEAKDLCVAAASMVRGARRVQLDQLDPAKRAERAVQPQRDARQLTQWQPCLFARFQWIFNVWPTQAAHRYFTDGCN